MSTDLKKPDDAPRTGSAADGAPSDDVGAEGVNASPQSEAAPEADDGEARVVRRFGTSAEVVDLPGSTREETEDNEDGRSEDDGTADGDEDGVEEGGDEEAAPPVHPDAVPGPADSTFSAFAGGGMLSLCILAFLLFWPALSGVGLFCAGEVDTAHLMHRLMDGPWLTPMAGGETLPPVTFWMLKGLKELLILGDLPADILLPLFGVLSAALAIIGVWGLTRALGFGARAGLAAGLMLLISPVFILLGNTLDTDALATGLMLLSLAGFCWGWTRERAFLSLLLGFVGALAAGMAGGFEFLLVPVVTSVIFLIRHMRFSRAQRWDAVIGFFVFLSLIGAWLTAAILLGGDKGYVAAFSSAFFATAPGLPLDLSGWLPEIPHVSPRVTNFVALTLLPLLPWLILPIFVSWNRAIRDAWQNAKHGEIRPGFLRTALVVTLIVQFFRPGVMLLAFTALIMPLFARALLRLSPFGSRMVHGILALIILHVGVFAALVSFDMLTDILPPELVTWYAGDLRKALVGMESLPIVAGCCLLAAIILLKFTRKAFPAGALLSLSLLVMLIAMPVRLMLLPEAAHLLPGLRGAAALTPAPAPAPEKKAEVKPAEKPAPAAPAPEAKKEATPAPAPEKKDEVKPAEKPAPAAPAPEAKKEAAPAPAPEKKAEAKPAEKRDPLAGEMKSAPDWDIISPLKGLVEKIQSNIAPR